MEDLNLRREFWKAMGWYIAEEDGELYLMKPLISVGGSHGMKGPREAIERALWQSFAPPAETDEGIALRELVKFCASFNPPLKWELYGSTEALCVIGEYGKQFSCEGGETPARAICLAVIAAVKGATK